MSYFFLKTDSFNFVPINKTPWGGSKIAEIKKKYFPNFLNKIPDHIGESWEVSTDIHYPSKIISDNKELNNKTLTEVLKNNNAQKILGESIFNKYGAHCPLLLKWLNASDFLSVQLHPNNHNPDLKPDECGKPESWLVLDIEKDGFVYLGFQEHLTQSQITEFLLNDEPEKCLYRYEPKVFDYISVPPGCVHAIGKGVFVAEPQYVLPQKSGKTWRISDWKRLYNKHGQKSETGKPRELHVKESINSIDWNLPRGKDLEKLLIKNLSEDSVFYGDKYNPFAISVFNEIGTFCYKPLFKNTFSIISVWSGEIIMKHNNKTSTLKGGESGLIVSNIDNIHLTLKSKNNDLPKAAFFSLNSEVI